LLEAVQRLRAQAKDAGNLASSEQLKVETVEQEGKEVITVSPPSKEIVYVPQYDPVAVYQPAPAAPAAPATTTTTTTQEGHSTGAMVATGLLSFGAGLLVANAFDDDDDDDWDDWDNYYGPPRPYYPPYPYRPAYGGGYYPNHGYNRPPSYNHGFNNNTIINVNNPNSNYWNRYDNKQYTRRGPTQVSSPISTAKRGNRPELAGLNSRAAQGPARKAPGVDDGWKGKSSYAGSRQQTGTARAGAGRDTPRVGQAGSQRTPKVQGSYAGAQRPKPAARPSASGGARPSAAPSNQMADRGRASSRPQARPTTRPAAAQQPQTQRRAQVQQPQSRSAVSGASRGKSDRAASQRGRQSHGGSRPSRGGGGGGRRG
jgi:hypothetical protein